ncbi:hypothetical protein Dimus_037906 [Dionaea muscipula]
MSSFACRNSFLAESLSILMSTCLLLSLSISTSISLIFFSCSVAASFSISYFATTPFMAMITDSISFFSTFSFSSFSSMSFFNSSYSSFTLVHPSLSFFHELITLAIQIFCDRRKHQCHIFGIKHSSITAHK